jgi:saccharopine dehydrogenase-like NADP-dependent oxidoreductase
MKTILVLGAGRSSSALIAYLLDYASKSGNKVLVGDISRDAAQKHVADHPSGEAITFDIGQGDQSSQLIAKAGIVASLLPAHHHHRVAEMCLHYGKDLVTASYVSDEMRKLDKPAQERSLIFLNECGLDPGIDHMSAMQVMDRIRNEGGRIESFKSFTGGLIAPETDPENPWRYKFTWNARNVVMAGQSTAKYLDNGKLKYIPYQQLFVRTTPVVVPGYGEFEGYANRDSLKYRSDYQLQDVRTLLRGTLRYRGFCSAWNVLVQLGCCDDTYPMSGVEKMRHVDFINSFLNDSKGTTEENLIAQFGLALNGGEMNRLRWSGLLSDELVGIATGTPAAILEHILNKRWKLKEGDKDLVVMWHEFGVDIHGRKKTIEASLVVKGENSQNTAMSRTVGLPMGIAVRLILERKVRQKGVVIPVTVEFYDPILAELKQKGIELAEKELAA